MSFLDIVLISYGMVAGFMGGFALSTRSEKAEARLTLAIQLYWGLIALTLLAVLTGERHELSIITAFIYFCVICVLVGMRGMRRIWKKREAAEALRDLGRQMKGPY